jgi:hypothetical protein
LNRWWSLISSPPAPGLCLSVDQRQGRTQGARTAVRKRWRTVSSGAPCWKATEAASRPARPGRRFERPFAFQNGMLSSPLSMWRNSSLAMILPARHTKPASRIRYAADELLFLEEAFACPSGLAIEVVGITRPNASRLVAAP